MPAVVFLWSLFIYNPENDGVCFFKTTSFISRNDAYIIWGVSHPSFLCLDRTFFPRFCLFRAFVCVCSALSIWVFWFFFCFLLFSWFCLVVVALCVLLHTRKVLAGLSHVGWKQCRHRQDTKTFFWDTYFCWKSTKQTNYTPIVPTIKIHLSLRMQRNLKWKSRVILVKYFCNYLLLETKSISFAS